MNFATDLPPLIDDLERVSQLPDSDNLDELRQSLLHRQEVLLKVKDYLVFLVKQGNQTTMGLPATPVTDAAAIAEAVIQELQIKKTEWVAPISQEVDQLNAQKQILEREIYRLNQQYETILRQFPEQLLSHFQDLLQSKLGKAVELFEQRLRYISSVTHSLPGLEDAGFAASEAQLVKATTDSEATLQTVQKRLDESLMNLDHTVRAVLNSLEQDVTAYQVSFTEQLQRLHSLGIGLMATTVTPPVAPTSAHNTALNLEPLEPSPTPELVTMPSPELPEVASLLALDSPSTEPEEIPSPVHDVLFGAEAIPYTAPPTTEPEPTEPPSTPDLLVQEQCLDFAASLSTENPIADHPVTAADLFGDRPEEPTDDPLTAIEVTTASLTPDTFLFGDPLISSDVEPTATETTGLQAVMATSASAIATPTSPSPESESTTVKTIKLLTDLLQDGALNVQETDESTTVHDDLDDLGVTEDLSPDLDAEDNAEAALQTTVLAPEQIEQLAADLSRFEAADSNPATEITIDVASSSDEPAVTPPPEDDNPW